MQSFPDRFDSQLQANRNVSAAAVDRTGFAALVRDTVWDVSRQTMQHYRKDGDAMQALIRGAEYDAAKASALAAAGTCRYPNNASYWMDFFGKSTAGSRLGAYESPDSTFQKYLVGWTNFKNRLDSAASVRMNLMLQSANPYTETAGVPFYKNT